MGKQMGRRWEVSTLLVASLTCLAFILTACRDSNDAGGLSGTVNIDGSSTVFPITQAVAEEFQRVHRAVRISLGLSGTGGGFEKFCRGEIDISNASRPIKEEEAETCAANGIDFTELTVAADGLSVIVNPDNDWVDCLTVEQLNQLWMPGSEIERWSDLDPSWPDEEIELYGPGTDSGTFDYFTEAINGESGASRADYTASEDDNVLVQGVQGDENALAYLGYAYYIENQEQLRAVPIDGGAGCIEPTTETIQSNTYAPLSRPLYIYVSNASLQPPDVQPVSGSDATGTPVVPTSVTAELIRYYLTEGTEVIPYIGYVPYDDAVYQEQRQLVQDAIDSGGR